MGDWTMFASGYMADDTNTGLPILVMGVRDNEVLCCGTTGELFLLPIECIRMPWRFDHEKGEWVEMTGELGDG
jgi:hypothetical protein